MIETQRGLPNTCTRCGCGPLTTWWAETEDHARAGMGYCWACVEAVEADNEPIGSAQSATEPQIGANGEETGQIEAQRTPEFAEDEDWLWTGLRKPVQDLLKAEGVSAAWLRTAPEDEVLALDRIKGIGPGTTHHILEMREELDDDDV